MNFKNVSVALLALLVLAGSIYAFILLWDAVTGPDGNQTSLPLLLLASILLILMGFAVVAMLYSVVGLSDSGQALGLPEGSIRALLAFGLVILFTILALTFFSQMGEFHVLTLSQTQYDELDVNIIMSAVQDAGTKEWAVGVRTASPAQVALAQQITAAMVTLVAAVAAFYFGSKSTDDRTLAQLLSALGPTDSMGATLSDLSLTASQVSLLRDAGIGSVAKLAISDLATVRNALALKDDVASNEQVNALISEAKSEI